MFTTVIQRFAQRLLPLALVVTVVGAMSGMALVACFAPDLVEYFVSRSGSIAPWRTEFDSLRVLVGQATANKGPMSAEEFIAFARELLDAARKADQTA